MKRLLLLVFSPAFVWVFYDFIFYIRPMYESGSYDFYFYLIVVFDFIAALTCVFFIVFSKRAQSLIVGGDRRLPFWIYPAVFCIVLTSYFFLLYSVFGEINPFNAFENYDYFYTKNSEGTAWVFLIINIFIFLLLYDVYRAGASGSRVFIIFASLLIVSMTGGRSTIIVQILFLLFIVYVVRGKSLKLSMIVSVIFLSLVVFLGNAVMRSGGFDSYIDGATHLDFDSSFILSDVSAYVESKGPAYLVSLNDFYNFFIPRFIDPDKPISTAETRLIYPDVAGWGTNYTFGFYANILLNLGHAGLFFAPIFLFLYQYLYYSFSLRFRSSFFGFFVLFFCFYSIQVVRGGVVNARFLIFIFSITMACLIWSILSRATLPARQSVTRASESVGRGF